MIKKWITALTVLGLSIPVISPCGILEVCADEDYSDEDAWYEKCTKVQTSKSGVEACEGFLAYEKEKKESLTSAIEDYADQIDNLEDSVEEMERLAQEQQTLITELNSQIENLEARIEEYTTGIEEVQTEIDAKQEEIDVWDAQIRARMQEEQASTGLNMALDLLMGSSDLTEMVRRLTGIERITQSDQSQVDELEKMKEDLDYHKEELVRLQSDLQDQKDDLDEKKDEAVILQAAYEQLEAEYDKQIADLRQAQIDAMSDLDSIREFSIQQASILAEDIQPVDGLIFPVQDGYQSAGTWAYPDGGMHVGLDWATSIGTPVVAPADGIILYANNPVGSDSGYLGNWSGWPSGAGNSVAMLINLNGTLYSISFFHLSQEGMTVKAGDTVKQGDVIALTGHSGNSTGPHCHIEIINLGDMSQEEALQTFSETLDFAWGTGWNSTATACENTNTTPCRERPEKYFLS